MTACRRASCKHRSRSLISRSGPSLRSSAQRSSFATSSSKCLALRSLASESRSATAALKTTGSSEGAGGMGSVDLGDPGSQTCPVDADNVSNLRKKSSGSRTPSSHIPARTIKSSSANPRTVSRAAVRNPLLPTCCSIRPIRPDEGPYSKFSCAYGNSSDAAFFMRSFASAWSAWKNVSPLPSHVCAN